MNFIYFENLSLRDADLFLNNFLEEESKGFNKIIPDLIKNGITVDYSYESIKPIIISEIKKIKTTKEKQDECLPSWITETESYRKGLYSFDETSKILILRISYYLGQCFVKNNKTLSWNIGNSATAEKNMPVIKGFKKKMELAPIMICENLFCRLIEGTDSSTIDTVISTWRSFI